MAACLITVSGTSGTVRVDYKVGLVDKFVTSPIGTFYLEDTSTNLTYTTLSGNAIASSSCFTIINLPYNYYKLNWKGICTPGYIVHKIILGLTEYVIPNTVFPISKDDLINNINDAGIERFKIIAYKYNYNGIMPVVDQEMSYIARIIGTNIPYIKVRDLDNESSIYIKGESSIELPIGFTPVEICETIVLP